MSKRDIQLLLADIIEAVDKIERYVQGYTRERFLEDEKTVDAVVRNFEIIGEAARSLPTDFTAQHAEVAWNQMIGLRNRIVHRYFGVDLDIIWQIVIHDLPTLRTQVSRLT